MKTAFLSVLLTFSCIACNQKDKESKPADTEKESAPIAEQTNSSGNYVSDNKLSDNTFPKIKLTDETVFEVRTYQGNLGWGFDVYLSGRKSIHQPMIPAVSGNQGFANAADADRVGKLMVFKMKNKILPPAISLKDLDSLKIIYKK